jgi:hypothetical protein
MTVVRASRAPSLPTRSRSRIVSPQIVEPAARREAVKKAATAIRPKVEIDFVRSVRK